ncbi:MAG: tRNA pseudouridine(55) synthase TruB, partial [Bacteroidia bacterium]|nr:tRNA pseudouridine(55) synthase TruB [Bacteroidia bacterium]MDW8334991.1 tRNA pseudouridine(55) synthase TruB [Bacteroidia bacterium]
MNVVRAGDELPQDFSSGYVIPVYKPCGWTSHDVVAKVRRRVKPAKIGHAGTLDPLADGLLILCTGKATKLVAKLQELKKTYSAVYRFGATTATDDADAPETQICDASHLTRDQIQAALDRLTGEILQRPPAFSALKKNGKRAYELARKGLDPELQPRPVTIYRHQIVEFVSGERVRVVVECSKGTYIRALARDAGEILGVGGYL